jgi:lantibiotic transport system permease protein
MNQYIHSLQSEWIKTRRSTASWLVIIGAFFIPLIIVTMRLIKADRLPGIYNSVDFLERTFVQNWQVMAFFLLPMGVILATSLITQLEYRNNTWKQLHTTPHGYSTIFFAKLTVIILMMLQFFVLFNIGIYLSAAIPALLVKGISMPVKLFPYLFFLKTNALFFVDCLPIIALQYLVSLQFKNFLVPLGFGIGLLVAATFAASWQYGYIIPYTYSLFNFFEMSSIKEGPSRAVNFHWVAVGYFIAGTIASYILYINKKDKC